MEKRCAAYGKDVHENYAVEEIFVKYDYIILNYRLLPQRRQGELISFRNSLQSSAKKTLTRQVLWAQVFLNEFINVIITANGAFFCNLREKMTERGIGKEKIFVKTVGPINTIVEHSCDVILAKQSRSVFGTFGLYKIK